MNYAKLLVLVFLLIYWSFSKYSRESFQWSTACNCQGNVIETKKGFSSMMRCGRDCLKNKDCNCFTFSASTCSLMNISNPNSLQTSTQSSICGLVQNRISKATSSDCISGRRVTMALTNGLITVLLHLLFMAKGRMLAIYLASILYVVAQWHA